jgi:hypothetical protein
MRTQTLKESELERFNLRTASAKELDQARKLSQHALELAQAGSLDDCWRDPEATRPGFIKGVQQNLKEIDAELDRRRFN